MKIMSLLDDEKVIQIIPAPSNLYLEYQQSNNQVTSTPALCLALTDKGEVYVMDVDACGLIDIAETISNFNGVVWKETTATHSRQ